MASLQEKCPDNAGPAAPTPTPVPVPAPCVIPAFAEACALLDAPYSCLVLDGHRRHVALPPVYLRKKKRGIREELSAELLKYSDSMKGVPLAFDDIKVVGPHADILDDQGYVHMNIEATFVVFKPKRGQKLKGVVNKLGQTHVGCLVHGCFNASVLKPGSLSVEAWRDSGLKVGDDLEFEVANLDADAAGVLLIRGRLTNDSETCAAARSPARKCPSSGVGKSCHRPHIWTGFQAHSITAHCAIYDYNNEQMKNQCISMVLIYHLVCYKMLCSTNVIHVTDHLLSHPPPHRKGTVSVLTPQYIA
uniref:DNA-directed RNA polymerase subunit n=1 Tax=Denticeps clupeoides TaxID=299321 RepID=A0AAY4DAQ5_9TELE